MVPLKNYIRVLDGFGNRWKSFCQSSATATSFRTQKWAAISRWRIPTLSSSRQTGECFHNVTVTGGKQRSEGPLSMKRELRDVQRQLEDLERSLARSGNAGRPRWDAKSRSSTSLLDRLEDEKREAEKQAMTSGHCCGNSRRRWREFASAWRLRTRTASREYERQRTREFIAAAPGRTAQHEDRSARAGNRDGCSRQEHLAEPAHQPRDIAAQAAQRSWPASRHWKSVVALRPLLAAHRVDGQRSHATAIAALRGTDGIRGRGEATA